MFGQYPLQVNGFKDLHECLEAAMNEGEMESAETCGRSGQEVSAQAPSSGALLKAYELHLLLLLSALVHRAAACADL